MHRENKWNGKLKEMIETLRSPYLNIFFLSFIDLQY